MSHLRGKFCQNGYIWKLQTCSKEFDKISMLQISKYFDFIAKGFVGFHGASVKSLFDNKVKSNVVKNHIKHHFYDHKASKSLQM